MSLESLKCVIAWLVPGLLLRWTDRLHQLRNASSVMWLGVRTSIAFDASHAIGLTSSTGGPALG
jgi:hypothetical protein